MAKHNYYAIVFSPSRAEIVRTWNACRTKTQGVSNVKFKGFREKEAAEKWILEQKAPDATKALDKTKAYVDGSFRAEGSPSDHLRGRWSDKWAEGSFDNKASYAGWGYLIVEKGRIIHRACGRTNAPAISRNIDGELQATIEAIKWAMAHGRDLVIYHDYSGIECWATGAWRAKSSVAIAYQQFIKTVPIKLDFVKVKGHAGDRYNEMADALAKAGLRGQGADSDKSSPIFL